MYFFFSLVLFYSFICCRYSLLFHGSTYSSIFTCLWLVGIGFWGHDGRRYTVLRRSLESSTPSELFSSVGSTGSPSPSLHISRLDFCRRLDPSHKGLGCHSLVLHRGHSTLRCLHQLRDVCKFEVLRFETNVWGFELIGQSQRTSW